MNACNHWVEAHPGPPLERRFFERDPRAVAPDLLGAVLIHGPTAGRIVETEAYLGAGDPAAHAFRGRTRRTEVLFGPAGHAYVYRTRQHCCLNVAVQGVGVPGCVLIRAVAPLAGIGIMRRRRGDLPDDRLADGPAKLCQALGIDMRHYASDLCGHAVRARAIRALGPLWIANGHRGDAQVTATPRIGISRAKDWHLRYVLGSEPGQPRGNAGGRSMRVGI